MLNILHGSAVCGSHMQIYLNITRNERKVGHPITYTDTNCSAILFIDSATMPGRTMPIGQLRRHVLRSFLVMVYNIFNVYIMLMIASRSCLQSVCNWSPRVWYGNVNLQVNANRCYPPSKTTDHK